MVPHISEVRIRNYKSIAQATVTLGPFTALVGPNGSGKSNFFDSLAFVQECLAESIELAFKNRGGINAVRRKSGGHPNNIQVELALQLSDWGTAKYGFTIVAGKSGAFRVKTESCVVCPFMGSEASFKVENGVFRREIRGIRPKVSSDRLALYAASGTDEFRPVYDFLTSMRFYSMAPERIRELQNPDAGDFLKRDGSNAAAVLKRLAEESKGNERYKRLCRLLSKVVQGLQGVKYHAIGQKETLQFRQDVGLKHPWRFDAPNMSDGTLRSLGLLLAVYQVGKASVVAVEEPEATVHPAVMELIVGVLLDAAQDRQVLITTHSPDILDHEGIQDEQIRAVTIDQNSTLICPLSEASRDAVREHLYTAGELLRSGELTPDVQTARKAATQPSLFSSRTRSEVQPA